MSEVLNLRPYQKTGVSWLCDEHPHKLLADDMGLGKTPQTIAAMNRLQSRRAVVVCPATVKIMWARKIAQWSTSLKTIFIIKTGRCKIPPNADVIIVNYDLLIKPAISRQLVARGRVMPYDVAIFDEARALKELKTKRTRAALGRNAFVHHTKRIWLLDGTPVPNRPIELFPILSTLAPEVIQPHLSYEEYGKYFCKGKKDIFGWDMKGHSHIEELSERLMSSGFFLRRTKEEVMDDLPDKVETMVELDIKPSTDLAFAPIATARRSLALDKLPLAKTYIQDLVSEVGKVVVFAHHRDVLETLHAELTGAVLVYGGMNADQKQKSIDAFVKDPNATVFLGQTIAGGSGVDGLQEVCSHIVFVELDWSPGVMDQAIDRCRRIGQKAQTVFVHYLAVPDSVDTQISDSLDKKRNVIEKLIRTSEMKEEPIMSIEQSLQSIAESLAILAGAGKPVHVPSTPAANAKKEKPKAEVKAVESKVVEIQPEAEAPEVKAEAKAEVKPEPKTAELTLADLQSAVSRFATGDNPEERKALIALAKSDILMPIAGVSKLIDIAPEHYQAVLEALALGPEAYLSKAMAAEDEI